MGVGKIFVALSVLIMPVLTIACALLDDTTEQTEAIQEIPVLSYEEQLWAREILVGSEYGSGTTKLRIWAKSPKLHIVGGTDNQREIVETCITEINCTLAKAGYSIQVIGDDREADILLYLVPVTDFQEIAEKHDFNLSVMNAGLFWTWWNEQKELTKAVVMLASDALYKDEILRHFALEEITQSLGFFNDNPQFPDSIFYANGDDGGTAQHLSELDQKLIIWTYSTFKPGAIYKRPTPPEPESDKTETEVSP